MRSIADEELELRTFRTFATRDLLNEAALGRMLAVLSTRRYSAGLEPMGDLEPLSTSKSSISRRFVQGTEQKLAELFGRDLSQLDLLAIFIDGVQLAEHCVVVALGVDGDGRKHPLGLWEGTTENKTVWSALLGQPDRARAGTRTAAAVRHRRWQGHSSSHPQHLRRLRSRSALPNP